MTYAAEAFFCRVSDYLGSSVLGPRRASPVFVGWLRTFQQGEETKLDREEGIPPTSGRKSKKARVEGSMIRRKARIHTGGIGGVRLGKVADDEQEHILEKRKGVKQATEEHSMSRRGFSGVESCV